MNLTNHLRRSIVVAAVATTVVVGVTGTAQADLAPTTTAPTASAAPGTLAAVTAPTAPRSVTAKAGNTKVKLAWLAPSSSGGATIDKYLVQRARAGGPWKTIAYPTTRSYTAGGLTNGTRYYFRVRAHTAAGWGPFSAAVKAVPRTKPTAPRSPTATPGNKAVKLAWLAPSSNGGAKVNKYAVQRAVAGGPWKNIAYPTTRSYTAGGLTNGTRYYFRIVAHNSAGWSPTSTAVNTVPRSVPTAPRSPTATPSSATVKLTWQPPSSTGGATIDKYEVQRAFSPAGPWEHLAYPTTPPHTAGGLLNGTTYYYRILAHNALGWSPASTVVNAVPRTVPDPPWLLTATPGNASVELTWEAPSHNGGATIDKYEVQQAGAVWTPVAYPTTLSYQATELSNGTGYAFRIRAHNAAGWSPASTMVEAIPRTVPAAPNALLAAPGFHPGEVDLNWAAPNNNGSLIDSYQVDQATSAGGQFTPIAHPKSISHMASGLNPGSTYYFRVWAHNAIGWSSQPSTVVAHTVPPVIPNAPTGCSAVQLYGPGTDTAYIDWSPPSSDGGALILNYRIDIWKVGGGLVTTINSFASQKLVSLPAGYYNARISARNSVGLSQYCEAWWYMK